MAITLDKYYEADQVPVATNGTPGSVYRDFNILSTETWIINQLGGSSSIDQTEVELLYSEDNGSTWINPFDSGATKIRCLHLSAGNVSKIFMTGVSFGGGTNHILRLLCKNYNSANTAEVSSWFNGVLRNGG